MLTNRHGDRFSFELVSENTYKLNPGTLLMDYVRCGSLYGEETFNPNQLGFIDPPGGPFMEVGDYRIENKIVKRIFCEGTNIFFEVQP